MLKNHLNKRFGTFGPEKPRRKHASGLRRGKENVSPTRRNDKAPLDALKNLSEMVIDEERKSIVNGMLLKYMKPASQPDLASCIILEVLEGGDKIRLPWCIEAVNANNNSSEWIWDVVQPGKSQSRQVKTTSEIIRDSPLVNAFYSKKTLSRVFEDGRQYKYGLRSVKKSKNNLYSVDTVENRLLRDEWQTLFQVHAEEGQSTESLKNRFNATQKMIRDASSKRIRVQDAMQTNYTTELRRSAVAFEKALEVKLGETFKGDSSVVKELGQLDLQSLVMKVVESDPDFFTFANACIAVASNSKTRGSRPEKCVPAILAGLSILRAGSTRRGNTFHHMLSCALVGSGAPVALLSDMLRGIGHGGEDCGCEEGSEEEGNEDAAATWLREECRDKRAKRSD